jgi:DNA adenine methylase
MSGSSIEEKETEIKLIECTDVERKQFSNKLKPIFKWSGGKRTELCFIYKYIPDLDTINLYIEPFVGGGALFFALEFRNNVINDIHPEVINFYRQYKSGNAGIIKNYLDEWNNEESKYYEIRDKISLNDDIIKSARFLYLRKTCFRGMLRYNSSGNFNIPFGKYKTYSYNEVLEPLKSRYEALFQNTEIHNRDFREIFEMYNDENNFVFLDQPYDSKFSNYGFDNFDEKQQEALAELFKNTRNKCLMVIGETPLIKQLYSGNDRNGLPFIKAYYSKKYAFKIKEGRVGKEINNNHLVITNY